MSARRYTPILLGGLALAAAFAGAPVAAAGLLLVVVVVVWRAAGPAGVRRNVAPPSSRRTVRFQAATTKPALLQRGGHPMVPIPQRLSPELGRLDPFVARALAAQAPRIERVPTPATAPVGRGTMAAGTDEDLVVEASGVDFNEQLMLMEAVGLAPLGEDGVYFPKS